MQNAERIKVTIMPDCKQALASNGRTYRIKDVKETFVTNQSSTGAELTYQISEGEELDAIIVDEYTVELQRFLR